MNIVGILGIVGGIFALLTLWHFPADWLFQTHKEALAKAKNKKVRLWHCTKYALAFVPMMLLMRVRESNGDSSLALELGWPVYTALAILFVSHYIIDSYVPVMLWAKYLRKAPQFADVDTTLPRHNPDGSVTMTKEQSEQLLAGTTPWHANPMYMTGSIPRGWSDKVVDRITYANDEDAFRAMAATPLGLVLMITMDQFFHIAFLVPVAVLMLL